jgi:hypothetical protein
MSILDPSAILAGLMSRLGVTPDAVQQAMALVTDAHAALAEIQAFKVGSTEAMAYFVTRLDKIQTSLDRIEATVKTGNPPLFTGFALVEEKNHAGPNGHSG